MTVKTFKAKSPLGYVVSCTEESWTHIITHGHDMMQKNDIAIKDAIEDPICIYKSAAYPEQRDVFFGRSKSATYGDKFVTKVVVDRPNECNDEGEIVSAWPQKDISGGLQKDGLRYINRKLGQKT